MVVREGEGSVWVSKLIVRAAFRSWFSGFPIDANVSIIITRRFITSAGGVMSFSGNGIRWKTVVGVILGSVATALGVAWIVNKFRKKNSNVQ